MNLEKLRGPTRSFLTLADFFTRSFMAGISRSGISRSFKTGLDSFPQRTCIVIGPECRPKPHVTKNKIFAGPEADEQRGCRQSARGAPNTRGTQACR